MDLLLTPNMHHYTPRKLNLHILIRAVSVDLLIGVTLLEALIYYYLPYYYYYHY